MCVKGSGPFGGRISAEAGRTGVFWLWRGDQSGKGCPREEGRGALCLPSAVISRAAIANCHHLSGSNQHRLIPLQEVFMADRSPTWVSQGVGRAAFSSVPRGRSHFQLRGATHMAWLMASSSSFKASGFPCLQPFFQNRVFLCPRLGKVLTFRNSCDETGPPAAPGQSRVVSHLKVHNLITSAKSLCPGRPHRHTLGAAHILGWEALLSPPAQLPPYPPGQPQASWRRKGGRHVKARSPPSLGSMWRQAPHSLPVGPELE